MILKKDFLKSINLAENSFLPVLLCLFLICFRNIDFLINPIFNQEEGSILFARAYELGWDALFLPYGGYWQFFQNLITIFSAQYFTLENAPILTTYFSILVNIVPVLLIFYGKSLDFLSYSNKCFVALLIILSMPVNFSYSITNSHFVLGLIIALILLTDYKSTTSVQFIFSIFLIFLGGFSGVIPIMLAPIFFLKYLHSKDKTTLFQVAALLIVFCVQAFFFLSSFFQKDEYVHVHRFGNFNLEYLSFKFFIHFLIGNLTGQDENLNRPFMLVSFLFFIWICYKRGAQKNFIIIVLALLSTSILSMVLSQNFAGGHRYFYVSNILFVILICLYSQDSKSNLSTWFVILLLSLSALDYKTSHVRMQLIQKLNWKDEVAKYKMDNLYHPKIYPIDVNGDDVQNAWEINLSKSEMPRN